MNDTKKIQLGLLEESFEINDDMNFNDLTDEKQTLANLNLDMSKTTNPLKTSSSEEEVLFDNLDDFNFEGELKIKIFGIGGAGNNMINHIANHTDINRAWLYAINTDYQVLKKMPKGMNVILIGKKVTKGLGSGSNPNVGQDAALEDKELLRKALANTDLLFIVSGMGKGTGTGASPIVAEIAKEMGILTISLVNLPSISNEGKNIYEKGSNGLEKLKKFTDGILTISNEKLFNDTKGKITLRESFDFANRVIGNVIYQIINLILVPSEVNVDFNDIRNFFNEKIEFQVNSFEFEDDENIKEKIVEKLSNEVYQDTLQGAKKIIINYRINPSVTNQFMHNIRTALESITGNKDLEVTFAVDYDEDIKYASLSMIIATTPHEPKINRDTLELEILNANFEHNSILDTNVKPATIELTTEKSGEINLEVESDTDHFGINNPFKENSDFFNLKNETPSSEASTGNYDDGEMTPTKLNKLISRTIPFKNQTRKIR